MSTKVPGGVWTPFVSSKYLKDIEGPGQEGENAQVIVALSTTHVLLASLHAEFFGHPMM